MYKKSSKRKLAFILCFVLAFFVCGCGKQDEKEKTQATTEETETTQEATEKTKDKEPITTEEDTENAGIVDAGISEDVYKAAYLDVIHEHRYDILQYSWQFFYDYETNSAKEQTPISIVDITGDEVPELIYMMAEDSWSASLHIWTYQDGGAKEIFAEIWDVAAGGGSYYILFQLEGSSDLYVHYETGDEWWNTSFSKYGFDQSGNYTALKTFEQVSHPDDDYSELIYEYTEDGHEINQETYQNETQKLFDSMNTVIIYNEHFNEEMAAMIDSKECMAMTYLEAETYLSEGLEEDASSVLKGLPNFTFASGVGAWSTDLTIYEDGTFEGMHHDSDMGDIGEGYDYGTVYICEFRGKFTDIKKVNDYTYSMQLETIEMKEQPGTEWIEDQVRYIASEPYGLHDAEEVFLYIPGAPTSELPQDFLDWVAMPNAWTPDDIPTALAGYGLYNPGGQAGFFGY